MMRMINNDDDDDVDSVLSVLRLKQVSLMLSAAW